MRGKNKRTGRAVKVFAWTTTVVEMKSRKGQTYEKQTAFVVYFFQTTSEVTVQEVKEWSGTTESSVQSIKGLQINTFSPVSVIYDAYYFCQ